MKSELKILIVDDHQLILEGIEKALLLKSKDYELIVHTADCCEMAYLKINEHRNYDLVVLDISLPPFKNSKIEDGEDLALIVRRLSPTARIIMMTGITDNFKIYKILKHINPEGFLLKSDVSGKEMKIIFNKILFGKSYYSSSILSIIKETKKYDEFVDYFDRSILYFLSQGVLTKNLSQFIPLSITAIEKRKRILKQYFNAEEKGDERLLYEARKEKLL